ISRHVATSKKSPNTAASPERRPAQLAKTSTGRCWTWATRNLMTCRLQRAHGDPRTITFGRADDPSQRPRRPRRAGLDPDDRQPRRFLVLPPPAGDAGVFLGATRRVPRDLEDRLAALSAGRGVGALHTPSVSGLLLLVWHAAAAVSQGPINRRRCAPSVSV